MKTQQSTIEKYFPFVFLAIAVHAGLVIWILHHSWGMSNSDLQEIITVSLKVGEHRSPTQLSAPMPRSNHRATNTIAAASSDATEDKGKTQRPSDRGSSLQQSDFGLAGRSVFFNPKPHYPIASRRMGEQGVVHLQLCVGSRGSVESVRLTQSSGYRNLDQSAIEAVKAWKFSAQSVTSENTSECYQLPIHFQLES